MPERDDDKKDAEQAEEVLPDLTPEGDPTGGAPKANVLGGGVLPDAQKKETV